MKRLSSSASSDASQGSPTKLHGEEYLAGGSNGLPGADSSAKKLNDWLSLSETCRVKRPREFFLPVRYEPGYRYPLVVWLHNNGFNETQVRQVMPHLSTRNYVGVGVRGSLAMDASGHRFEWSHTPAAVSRCEDAVWQAVDDACERYSIHRDRVFIAGYGAGGTMARRVAFQRSNQFAGCIALGGRMPRGNAVLSNLVSTRNLKNLWAVAIENPELREEQFEDDMRLVANARLRLDVRRYTTDDEMMTEVLRDVNAWMMRIVTGAPEDPTASEKWATTPVGFSSN